MNACFVTKINNCLLHHTNIMIAYYFKSNIYYLHQMVLIYDSLTVFFFMFNYHIKSKTINASNISERDTLLTSPPTQFFRKL